jgi:beta-galactosidase
MKEYFKGNYDDQVRAAFQPLFRDNIDAAVIDIGHDPIAGYKLVVLSSAYVMDAQTAQAVRSYVANGGTVIMTGYSAKVDETGKWFETPLPGRLADVFGLRTNEFYRSEQPLRFMFDGAMRTGTDNYYEVLELSTARPLAMFENTPKPSPAISINKYGKGQAIYLATAAQPGFIEPLVRSLYGSLGIERGPETPEGVAARVVEGRTLYVNTNNAPATVALPGTRTGLLTHRTYSGTLELPAYGVELVQ